ncbi:Uncharacterised protein [Mycobacterium tuberculosis]|nr:Uncharacterised protein [Mycobacterium tuberculosis]
MKLCRRVHARRASALALAPRVEPHQICCLKKPIYLTGIVALEVANK